MELRPTTATDLPALHALFLASLGGVFRQHGFEPPSPTLEFFAGQQGHLLETGTCFVAEDDGRPAGYVSAWGRGDDWFLGSLFIAPQAQGRGVGSALLDAVWGDHPRRRTLTDAIQPISNALYGRRGLVPATPLLTFNGRPSIGAAAAEPAEADLAAVDAAAYGFDRSIDHVYWARFARRTTWPGAYSYVFPGGTIGPVGGVGPPAAAAALQSELARAEGDVTVRIPGSARALVEVALRAGLRLAPVPGLLLLSEGLRPPDALAIASYTLY